MTTKLTSTQKIDPTAAKIVKTAKTITKLAKKVAKKASGKKSRRNQKKTPGRTAVSRKARRVRRDFFNRQMELEFLIASGAPASEIAKAKARFATVEEQFNALPKLAARLEVPKKVALAALRDEDEDGDEE